MAYAPKWPHYLGKFLLSICIYLYQVGTTAIEKASPFLSLRFSPTSPC